MPLWAEAPVAPTQTLNLAAGISATAAAQSGDFTYTSSNGAVTITGYTGVGGAVVIPALIDALPVRVIGASAFQGKASLTSVSIPASVTSISDEAFRECTGITSVSIPAGVTSIGDSAFYYCTGLTSISIPASVTTIGRAAFGQTGLSAINLDPANAAYMLVEGVLYNRALTTLIQCPAKKIGSVVIPASVTSIGDEAFFSCTGITSVSIPAGVTSIGGYAFFICTGLTSISIPASVTTIGSFAFARCYGLTAINVDPANAAYMAVEGVLYNRALTTLIQCPGQKTGSVVIPASVTSISSEAFFDSTGLTSVSIPASVTSIGDRAFYYCTGLTNVLCFGNAPTTQFEAFTYTPATIYRLATATGWSSTSDGRPVRIFQPLDVSVNQKTIAIVEANADLVLKRGQGTTVLTTPATRTGGTVVEAGELVVRQKDALGTGLLEVQAGAKATLQTGYDTVSVTSLSLASTSRLELGTSKLTVSASGFSESDIRSKLIAGRNGGSWDGASGITSTFAGGDRAIGYRVADGALEVAYAAPGDSNLDGVIDILDIGDILSAGKFNTGEPANWQQGDVNYDNVFDIVDLADILGTTLFNQGTYLTQGSTRSTAVETGTVATFDSALLFAAFAAEPTTQPTTRRKLL